MNKPLIDDLDRFLAELHEQEEQETPQPEAATNLPEDIPTIEEPERPTVHIYYVDDDEELPPVPAETEVPTVESTPGIASDILHTRTPQTEATVPLTSPAHHPMTSRRLLLVLCLIALLGLLVGVAWYGTPIWFAPTATVTLVPRSQVITAPATLTVVLTGTVHPEQGQVPGRRLSILTLSQDKTVPTSGTGHQQARAARGWVTFYNALPAEQTVPAGTLLVGADGVQVVTEQDAVLPAGSLSTNGQASVSAHATMSGPTGNIGAHDLYGACCRENVFVQNPSAFSGGQDARSFPMVSRQDVESVVSTLKTSLDESVQAALSTQAHADETVITPVPCTAQVVIDHIVGTEALQVHITVNETCTGAVYQTQAVHALVMQAVQHEAMKQVGAGYTLSGEVKERVIQSRVIDQHQGTVQMQVSGTGIWTYQFTPASLQSLSILIVGKSKQEAIQRVLGLSGVQSVSIHIDGRDGSTLPNDPQHIHVLVIYGV